MTHFDLYVSLGVFLTGILLGGLPAWLVLRGREKAMIDGAVAQARAAASVELNAASLRARQAESTQAQLRTERAEAKANEERLTMVPSPSSRMCQISRRMHANTPNTLIP